MDTISIDELVMPDANDLSALNDLLQQLDSEDKILTNEMLEEIVKAPDVYLLVARKNTKIVGTVTVVVHKQIVGKKASLEDVVVDVSHRGQGIGKALMTSAVDIARKERAESINFTSRPTREIANNMYQKMGFEKRETNVYRLEL